jgi:AcrR family transcriptional regulator
VVRRHRDLRLALVGTAFELAAKQGPEAVSVRDVCRQLGVSHNAAYRHYPTRDELLQRVAERAFDEFAAYLADRVGQAGAGSDTEAAWDRLWACCRGYVEFAIEQPGLFRTVCAFPAGTIALESDRARPYDQLERCLDGLVEAGAVPADRRAGAEIAVWSGVHGFVFLLDGLLRDATPPDVDKYIDEVLHRLRHGI